MMESLSAPQDQGRQLNAGVLASINTRKFEDTERVETKEALAAKIDEELVEVKERAGGMRERYGGIM